jgi:hypothetical protein
MSTQERRAIMNEPRDLIDCEFAVLMPLLTARRQESHDMTTYDLFGGALCCLQLAIT